MENELEGAPSVRDIRERGEFGSRGDAPPPFIVASGEAPLMRHGGQASWRVRGDRGFRGEAGPPRRRP
jgi:hypothetical protein